MIFKDYKISKISFISDKEKRKKEILESIAGKFNSDYNEFLKKKIKEEKEKNIELNKEELDENKKDKDKSKRKIKTYYIPSFKNKLLYYNGSFYAYTPSNVKIERVPQGILGNNVLGRAFPGANVIQILDTLYGLDFEEVKKHEVNHILYPFLTEDQIRLKTKQELPFYTKYH